jgi:hypothetical protein
LQSLLGAPIDEHARLGSNQLWQQIGPLELWFQMRGL